MKKIWTEKEVEFLIAHYDTMKTDELIKNLNNKNNNQIRWKAKEYKLKKKISKTKKDISFLEDLDKPENCYWWGFIAADGCFNSKQLIIALAEKDKDHLNKFAQKTKAKMTKSFSINSYNPLGHIMYRVTINDNYIIPSLLARFNILPRKTYNPFNITEFMTESRLCFFLAGLIDGDGHISKHQYVIDIKMHPNWKHKLEEISHNLLKNYDIASYISTTKDGWVILKIPKKDNISKLKNLIYNKIPLLERKWN